MRNLLVTGGAGFIGSNFVRFLLKAETEVRVVNLDALTYAGNLENLRELPAPDRHVFVRGDICERELIDALLRRYQIDTIVHFAAETHVDRSILGPGQFIQTNIIGTFTLLEAVRQYWLVEKALKGAPVRFHHISTDEVYGSLEEEAPAWTEETPYAPNSPYAASKAASDHLVRSYGHTFGLPYSISNCSNNYGPYQFPEKLIPLMILNALDGKPLPVYGDGARFAERILVIPRLPLRIECVNIYASQQFRRCVKTMPEFCIPLQCGKNIAYRIPHVSQCLIEKVGRHQGLSVMQQQAVFLFRAEAVKM